MVTEDLQSLLVDDIYVMHFFRYRRGESAYNTFACSRDLENWTIWEGKPLVESKPWFVRHNGRNYHYYCAYNRNRERFIAVAVSE